MSRWLTEEEQRAWRGLLRMTSQLNARMNRQLLQEYGISLADYEVLVVLSEAPEGRLRVFEVADALAWEQSRVSHQLARMQRRGLVARRGLRERRPGRVRGPGRRQAAPPSSGPPRPTSRRCGNWSSTASSHDQLAALTEVTTRVLDRLAATAG